MLSSLVGGKISLMGYKLEFLEKEWVECNGKYQNVSYLEGKVFFRETFISVYLCMLWCKMYFLQWITFNKKFENHWFIGAPGLLNNVYSMSLV